MVDKQASDRNILIKSVQLTENAKARIRAEEIYREEIRLKPMGKFWWLNQPFVIFLFSTVVVGGLSFLYKDFSEQMANRELNYQKATEIRFEISFRISQVDELISNSQEARRDASQLSDEEFLNIISQERLSSSGEKLKRFFQSAPQLKVVSDLGGIGSPPRTDESATVWIGGSGWSNSHLPRGRGYRRDEFKDFSLHDLMETYWQVAPGEAPGEGDVSELRQLFAKFDEATKPSTTITKLPSIASNALTMKEWSERSSLETIKTTTDDVMGWVDLIITAWERIKSRLPETPSS